METVAQTTTRFVTNYVTTSNVDVATVTNFVTSTFFNKRTVVEYAAQTDWGGMDKKRAENPERPEPPAPSPAPASMPALSPCVCRLQSGGEVGGNWCLRPTVPK